MKQELRTCDGCGTIFGMGGTNTDGWAQVSVPYPDGALGYSARPMNLWPSETLDYCRNCWQLVEPHLPRLQRPAYPMTKAKEK